MRTFAIIILTWSAGFVGEDLLAAGDALRPIHTNKTRFRIPYNFDTTEMQKLGAQEIRLFVSTNRGERWQQVQAVSPEAGKFNFQAPGDGEYWFSVRTVDGQNRLHPADQSTEPGLKVVVDTTAPRLELTLRQTAPGRVQLAWKARDEYLDPTKLRLEFIQQGVSNWQVVGVIPKAADQTEWSIPQGGHVAVRGSISDLAGNLGQSQAEVQIAPGNEGAGGSEGRPAPVAGNDPIPSSYSASVPTDQHPTAAHYPRRNTDAPAMNPIPGDPPQFANAAATENSFRGSFSGQRGANSLVSHNNSGHPSASRPQETEGHEAAAGAYKADARTRVVNARQFQVGYKIQDVGPSGVSSVELYITQDNGRKWWKYGEDADKQSPFQVDVPAEGTYGFTLLVRSGVGLAADPPQPGDKPSMFVVVDETPPQVQLLPVEQGRGSATNKLVIQWTAQDEHLAERPVLLSYAANRQGPWQPIAGAMENSQSYTWTVGPEAPSKFYIRLEVRDSAGNMQRVETQSPIFIDLSRPSARIIDVEPGNTSSGPQ